MLLSQTLIVIPGSLKFIFPFGIETVLIGPDARLRAVKKFRSSQSFIHSGFPAGYRLLIAATATAIASATGTASAAGHVRQEGVEAADTTLLFEFFRILKRT